MHSDFDLDALKQSPRSATVTDVEDLCEELESARKLIGELQAECVEQRRSFELRWKADMRAIERWQKAHPGNDLTSPDHADLVVWLLEQLEQRNE